MHLQKRRETFFFEILQKPNLISRDYFSWPQKSSSSRCKNIKSRSYPKLKQKNCTTHLKLFSVFQKKKMICGAPYFCGCLKLFFYPWLKNPTKKKNNNDKNEILRKIYMIKFFFFFFFFLRRPKTVTGTFQATGQLQA